MKNKALKSVIATFLAAVIALSCFTASFAASDTLVWHYYEEPMNYDYQGILVEGENSIGSPDSDYVWYTFDVQSAGFYKLSFDYDDADLWFDTPEKIENGIAYDSAEKLTFSTDGINNTLFYFEEGEQIIGIMVEYSSSDSKLNIEYFGEEITSVEVADEKNLVLGCDIHCDYGIEEGALYYYWIDSDININFSSGKTITTDDVEGYIDSEIKKGENILPVSICGEKYTLAINVELVTDYIADVSISNIEDYLYFKTYYNSYDFPELYGETMTVTFKDGTTAAANIGDDEMITLPNGIEAWFGFGYTFDDGEILLDVYIAGTIVKSYECNETKADFKENIGELRSTYLELINDVSYYLRRAMIVALECDTIYEYLDYGAYESALRLRWACESFVSLFFEAFYLVGYYLA